VTCGAPEPVRKGLRFGGVGCAECRLSSGEARLVILHADRPLGQSRLRTFPGSQRAVCVIITGVTHPLQPAGDDARQSSAEAPGRIPRHVAIVSDGSARWALRNGVPIGGGHASAADTVVARIADAIDFGIQELTLYAFSTENWTRPPSEVRALLEMLAQRITQDAPTLAAQGVRVRFVGRRDRAGTALVEAFEYAEQMTCDNEALDVYVAFDYGGRDEIVAAAERYSGGGEAAFARLLGTAGMRDPDLLIRTSGEQRLSNFLLWQAAYAELIFRSELWPDFDRTAFEECLTEYAERVRRFGGRIVESAPAGLFAADSPAPMAGRLAG
jgi:undecaprenyl diphosphate synthase